MQLTKCPECGKIPTLSEAGREYKYFCGVHRSCGEWYGTKEKAAEDWNLRASFASEYDDERYWGKSDSYRDLLEAAATELENCYGGDSDLTQRIRLFLSKED